MTDIVERLRAIYRVAHELESDGEPMPSGLTEALPEAADRIASDAILIERLRIEVETLQRIIMDIADRVLKPGQG